MLSYLATGSFNGKVTGLDRAEQPVRGRCTEQGNYVPPIEAIYWSMRGMAYAGSFVALVSLIGAFLYWKRRLERLKWFLWVGVVTIFLPFVACTFGWCLTEIGRQPWIVQGLLKTAERELAERRHDVARDQPHRLRRAVHRLAHRRRLADAALRGARSE